VKFQEQLKSTAALPAAVGESQVSEQATPQFVNELVIERLLGVSVKTLRNWRVSGRGPPFSKFGASVRYELATAIRWARERQVNSTSEAALMPPSKRQRRVAGGAAPSATVRTSAQSSSRSIGTAQLLGLDPRFRRWLNRLWRLRPRLTGEPLLEIAAAHGLEADVLDRLERFARIGPALVARHNARDWPPLPLSEMA